MTDTMKRIVLAERPKGFPTDANFRLEEAAVPTPGEGEVVVAVKYMSLDPYMRGRMDDGPSYAAPVPVGGTMEAGAVGEVIASNDPKFKPGDHAFGMFGWATHGVAAAKGLRKVNPDDAPIQTSLGVLGMPGMTAYAGLLEVGELKDGDNVVVSAASGAVGAVVGQIAKIKGCHVVGLTGSDEKCQWITRELGFDAAINYKTENVAEALAKTCPNGIDVYFDNVGGKILDECLKQMNLHGRIPTCGLISQYNATEPVPGPYNYDLILMHRLKIQGFIILDYMDRYPEATEALIGWMKEGRLKARLDVSEGLETALQAVKKLYTGENTGKLMVRVKDV